MLIKPSERNASTPLRCAVVGLGRAGQSRIKAFAQRNDAHIVAVASRRDSKTASFEEILANPNIDAVLICQETRVHAQRVRAALMSGKHVLVEYPLSLDASESEDLVNCARHMGVCLHIGLVALMTQYHAWVAERLMSQPYTCVKMGFTGGYGRAVRWEAQQRYRGELATSRLHSLWSWLGPLSLTDVQIEADDAGYQLWTQFENSSGGRVELHEHRRVELRRSKRLLVESRDGQVYDYPNEHGAKGAFSRDVEEFLRRVRGEDDGGLAAHQQAVIAVARLAQEISVKARKRLPLSSTSW